MSIFDELPIAGELPSDGYLSIHEVTRDRSKFGDYLRVEGFRPDGSSDFVFIDSKDFPLAEPYLIKWRQGEVTLLPVFTGRDGRLRFSSATARTHQGLTAPDPNESSERERPTVKGDVALRLRRESQRMGLSVSDAAMLHLDKSLPR